MGMQFRLAAAALLYYDGMHSMPIVQTFSRIHHALGVGVLANDLAGSNRPSSGAACAVEGRF